VRELDVHRSCPVEPRSRQRLLDHSVVGSASSVSSVRMRADPHKQLDAIEGRQGTQNYPNRQFASKILRRSASP
jgi:hypothetical protein